MPVSSQPIDDDDVDVACERRRVLRGDADNDMLKIDNLTKVCPRFDPPRSNGKIRQARLLQARTVCALCLISGCVTGVQVSQDGSDPGRGPAVSRGSARRVFRAAGSEWSRQDVHL